MNQKFKYHLTTILFALLLTVGVMVFVTSVVACCYVVYLFPEIASPIILFLICWVSLLPVAYTLRDLFFEIKKKEEVEE